VVKKRALISLLLLGIPFSAVGGERLLDPMRPLVSSASGPVETVGKPLVAKQLDWRLGAVLISAEREVAVINGKSLQIGDKIEGYRVVKIEPSRVQLQMKKKKMILRRAGSGLKKAFLSQDVGKGSHP